ncbi:unnamed protein product [Prorocentrum cordatum]|uniref:Uncharacterized protein n=1 Tax=Prorocentrum cordatum TaxID=2364126 RepID=A0ABN9W108_9DINO|nr:unnamed protein product [Polarella glacialis]
MARAASALGVPPRSLARSPPFPLEIELFEEKEEEEAADEPPVRTLFVHAAPEEGEEEEAEAAEEAAEEEEEEEEAAVVPFAAALEQLARAHEACLAAAQQEKCQLRAEISRLKGRIGMLMLALQRSGSPAPSPRREAAAAGSPAARGAARPTAAERPAAAACVSPQLQSSRSAGAPPEAPAATRPSNSPSQRRPLSPRVPEVPRPAPARAPTPPEAEGSPGGSLGRAAGEAASEAAGEAASEAGGEEAPAAEEKEERVTVLTVCGSDRGDDELKDDRNTLLTVEVAFQTSPEKNWSRLVGKFLNNVANKELLCLNPDWVKSTDFIRKVERSWNHVPGATDILANPEFNPRARKNTVTLEHSTFLRRSIFSGSSWGTPGQSYRTPHSALGEDGNVVVRFLGGLVMDPQSPKRICIGMLGLLLMVVADTTFS